MKKSPPSQNRLKLGVVQKPFKLTAPKPYIPKEYDDQVEIFEYAAGAAERDERWGMLFATLNGVRLPIGLAKKMKRAGNKQGVPDMFLPVPRWDFDHCIHGLWIELKREKGGVISDTQKWWHQQLTETGYRVVVSRGAKEAIKIITEYLGA